MVRRERRTPPTSRFSMGVPDTAMAAETAVATMVENFIVKVVGEFKVRVSQWLFFNFGTDENKMKDLQGRSNVL